MNHDPLPQLRERGDNMSCIGEARGFAKEAARLRKRLATETDLTQEERTALEVKAEWFDDESADCWRYADQEARADAAAERLEAERDEDEDEEDDDDTD